VLLETAQAYSLAIASAATQHNMTKERCWKCKKMRNDVELCATDDRLCQSCFRKNEEELESAQRRRNTTVTTRSSGQVGAIVRTTDINNSTTRRDDDVAEPSTSKVTHLENVVTGPSIGHQTTIIRCDVAAAGSAPSIESQTTGSTACREYVTAGFKPSIERQAASDDQTDHPNRYHQQIENLKCQVDYLTGTVAKLTTQLSFVLSFFDIDAVCNDVSSHHDHRAEPLSGKAPMENHLTATANQATRLNEATLHPYPAKSFVDVIRQSVRAMPIDGKSCTDIAAAMYVEQNNKDRRANSFIISGLPANRSTSDSGLVEDLCRNELGISVGLLSSKRIGKETSNKPRHLLAYVQSRDQAQAVINSAKKLRNSNDNFVRTNVFINPNLTKAESKAQFELRQRRRQAYEAHQHGTDKQESVRITPAAQQSVSIPEQQLSTPSSSEDQVHGRPDNATQH
jgi:hypothetical protein